MLWRTFVVDICYSVCTQSAAIMFNRLKLFLKGGYRTDRKRNFKSFYIYHIFEMGSFSDHFFRGVQNRPNYGIDGSLQPLGLGVLKVTLTQRPNHKLQICAHYQFPIDANMMLRAHVASISVDHASRHVLYMYRMSIGSSTLTNATTVFAISRTPPVPSIAHNHSTTVPLINRYTTVFVV